MWKQEATKTTTRAIPQPAVPVAQFKATVVARIGPSVCIKGDVTSAEDLAIDGQVEGTIDVGGYRLTIGAGATILGEVEARAISISGAVTGNVIATERIEIWETGSVDGDLTAPRLAVRDGAEVRGRIDTRAARVQHLAVAV